jgi:hypothetical protein
VTERITLDLTKTEKAWIERMAGDVPVQRFLRNIIFRSLHVEKTAA